MSQEVSKVIGGLQVQRFDYTGLDYHPTPECATKLLFDYVEFDGDIWEPASGDGAISKYLEEVKKLKVYSSDIAEYDWIYGEKKIDFLKSDRKCDNVITNPPYNKNVKFIEKLFDTCNKKFALLLQLNSLSGIERYKFYNSGYLSNLIVISNILPYFTNGEWKKGGFLRHIWIVFDLTKKSNCNIVWAKSDGVIRYER